MRPYMRTPGHCYRGEPRRGMSLIELLMAMAVLSIVSVAAVGLSSGVHQTWTYGQEYGTATQHARVVLQRIGVLVAEAHHTPLIPGVAVLYEDDGGSRFYDTLVIWHADAATTNPDGPPLASECVVICPDPDDPTRLVEIRDYSDMRKIIVEDKEINKPTARAVINDVKTSPTAEKTLLTDRLRAPSLALGGARRGSVHFFSRQTPTINEISDHEDDLLDWEDMSWPQGRFGSQTAMRQYHLRIELQLMPSREDAVNATNDGRAMGYFGSAAHYYRVDRVN